MSDQQPTHPSQTSPTSGDTHPGSYVDSYQPPASQSSPTHSPPAIKNPSSGTSTNKPSSATPNQGTTAGSSESLEAQNIFDLLGIANGSEAEKDKFLDELQQVIWEDFIENDLKLLFTQEEYDQAQQLIDQEDKNDLQKQEELIGYLEKLIPDLEEILLEKALELKEEMVHERVAGLREFYAGKQEQLAKIDQAVELLKIDKWASAAKVLNQLS